MRPAAPFFKNIKGEKHHGRDGEVDKHPLHGSRIVAGSPQLVYRR